MLNFLKRLFWVGTPSIDAVIAMSDDEQARYDDYHNGTAWGR